MARILLTHPHGFRFLEGSVDDYVVGGPVDTGFYGDYVVNKIVPIKPFSELVGFDIGIWAISLADWEKGVLIHKKRRIRDLLHFALIIISITTSVIILITK